MDYTEPGRLSDRTRQSRAQVLSELAPELADRALALVEDGHYPGVSVGVVLDGHVHWTTQAGVRDTTSDAPVTPRTCFRLASITKTLTALEVLALRDAGQLSLDQPIAEVLPPAQTWIPPTTDSPPVTWRHLLTHTSGLPRVGPIDFTRTDTPLGRRELVSALNRLPLTQSPGTTTRYSNLGYVVLGLAISKVAGIPYETAIRKRFLSPLGMRDAGFRREDCREVATGYTRRRTADARRPERQADWQFGAAAAAGGLYASVEATSAWLAFQLDAWPPRNAPDTGPVRRATRRESHRLGGYSHPGQPSFGLGWGVASFGRYGDVLVSHTGATWTWGASVRMLVERGIAVVALGNRGGSAPLSRFTLEVIRRIDAALADKGLVRHSRVRATPVRLRPR